LFYFLSKRNNEFLANFGPLKPPAMRLPIGLYEGWSFTKQVSTTSSYVKRPSKSNSNQLKVAVFGGSAAIGYTSERSISQIIAVYLKQYDSNAELFVANYAFSGSPFCQSQAKIIEAVIDAYDVFIVYAGNNEGSPYIINNGIWSGQPPAVAHYPDSTVSPRIEYESRVLNGFLMFEDIVEFINTRSRLYAFVVRLNLKFRGVLKKIFRDKSSSENGFENIALRKSDENVGSRIFPSPFEAEPIIPKEEFSNLIEGFENDLTKVCRLIESKDKTLIFSMTVTNESMPPFFSIIDRNWTEENTISFISIAEKSQRLIDNTNFDAAINLISKEVGLDNEIAIFNFQIGTCYKELGMLEKSHIYFRRSIDYDGFYFRSTKFIQAVAEDVIERYKNSYFLDTISEFQKAVDNGWSWNDLYSDVNHATFAGNSIIARNLSNKLIEILALGENNKSIGPKNLAREFSPTDLKTLKETFKISKSEQAANKFLAARWHTGISAASAYPNSLLQRAETLLDEYQSLLEKSDTFDLALLELYRSLISIKTNNIEKACQQANTAFCTLPDTVKDIMAGRGHFSHSLSISSVSSVFKNSPIQFSPKFGFSID